MSMTFEAAMRPWSFEYVVEGILLFIVGIIGIFANVVAMIIFKEKGTHIFHRSSSIAK